MRFLLSLVLLSTLVPSVRAATYLLLSQTNGLAAGITNAAKTYADTKQLGSVNLTNWSALSTNVLGASAPTGTVVNLVAPVQVGRPLVYSSLTGTNAIPGYTSLPEYSLTGNQTLTFTNDSQALIWNSATNCTLTFDATTVTNGWEVVIKSLGAGSLILTNNSGLTFDGVTSLSLPVGVFGIGANGTNFRTLRISPNGVPAQNLFYASPDGASGVPRMRAIVVADVAASIVTSQQTNATLASLGGVTTNAPAIATGSVAAFSSSNTIGAATSANLSNAIGSSVFVPIGGGTMTGLLSSPSGAISSLLIGSMGIGSRTTLTEAGGIVTCDLSLTNRYWTCSPTGNVTIAISNPSAGNWGNLLLRWPSTNCQFTLAWSSSSSTTNWLSGVPSTNATANTIGFLGIYPQDATTNSTIAGYSATQ